MNGATFVPALGTIAFSTDTNGDRDYADAGEVLNWYQFRVVIDYSGATPHFDLARGVVRVQSDYSVTANNLTAWVSGAPATGAKAGLLCFANVGADVLVDQVW